MKQIIPKTNHILFVLTLIVLVIVPISVGAQGSGVQSDSYSAVITWSTDKPCISQVEYGTSESYGELTPQTAVLTTRHRISLIDLNPSSRYHYRVKSIDAYGNEAVGPDLTFTTLEEIARNQPPRISDIEADMIIAAGPVSDRASETARTYASYTEKSRAEAEELADLSKEAGQLVKRDAPIEESLINKGGLLLPKGTWQIEPSFSYAHVSANRVAFLGYTIIPVLVVGEISSEEVKRDIFIQTLTTRYGLMDDVQLELRVPYRYQRDRISVGTTSESTRHMQGLGDIEAGIQYQFAHEEGAMPDLIAGFSVKSRTGKEPYGRDIGIGTGHWAAKTSLVAVKSSDPAIVYGGLGYTYNFKRDDIPDYGTIKPGNSYDYRIGAAFALNYQFALSLQLEQIISEKMRMNQSSVPGSLTNVVNFKYGVTWAMSENFSCEITAANGLTEDAPNFSLEIRFPYTF